MRIFRAGVSSKNNPQALLISFLRSNIALLAALLALPVLAGVTCTAPGSAQAAPVAISAPSSTQTSLVGTAAPLTAVTITASLAPPQPINTPITFTATATGGTNVQYQFWLYNPSANPAWSQLQAYSSSNTCSWTPSTPGAYLLSATALDGATGTEVNQTFWYSVANTTLSSLTVATTSASPQLINTPITLVAAANGGTNVQYQFWVYNTLANPAWTQLQAYSSQATYQWTPTTPGTYLLSVTAQDGASGYAVNNTFWYTITAPTITAVSLAATPAAPQSANTPITLTAAATGGTNVQYQFWQYNPAATPTWSQLQAYSASPTCQWTPATAGNYLLSVTAQDGVTGAQVSNSCWYAITGGAPITSLTIAAVPNSPQVVNTPITFVAAVTGGTYVQYQFWLYNPAATPAWSPLQGFSTQPTCTWAPATAGNYLLSVTAQDVITGSQMNQLLWYTITGTSLSTVTVTASPATPQPAGSTPVTLTAAATGGANVQYQFWVYNPSATPAWSQLQAYSSSPTCAWTPATPGNYMFSVTAQDGVTGAEVNTTLWYTVTFNQPNPQIINGNLTQIVDVGSTTPFTLVFQNPTTGQLLANTTVWAQVINSNIGATAYSLANTGGLSVNNGTPAQSVAFTTDANGQATLAYTAASQIANGVTVTFYNYAGMQSANAYGTTVQFNVILLGPTSVVLTPKSSTEIDLSWTAITNAVSYEIQRSTDCLNWTTVIANLAAANTTYNDGTYATRLQPATTYYYQVCANTTVGASQFSSVVSTTTFPAAPTTVTATPYSTTEIDLTWNTVAGATGYRVFYKTATAATYTQFGADLLPSTNQTYPSYSVTGLLPNTGYDFEIAAFNASGASYSASIASNTNTAITVQKLTATTLAPPIYYSSIPTDIIPNANAVPLKTPITITGTGAGGAPAAGATVSITTLDKGSFAVNGANQNVLPDLKTITGTLGVDGTMSIYFLGRAPSWAVSGVSTIVLPTSAELGTPNLIASANGTTFPLTGASNTLPLLIGPPNKIVMSVTNPESVVNQSNQYFTTNVNTPWGYADQTLTVAANVYDLNNQPVLPGTLIWFGQSWNPCTDVNVTPSNSYYQSTVDAGTICSALTQTNVNGAVTNVSFGSNHSGEYSLQCFALIPNADTTTLETINNINPAVQNGANWNEVVANALTTDSTLTTQVTASQNIWIDTYVAFNTTTGGSGWSDPMITVGSETATWSPNNVTPLGISCDGTQSAKVTVTGQDFDGKAVLPGTPFTVKGELYMWPTATMDFDLGPAALFQDNETPITSSTLMYFNGLSQGDVICKGNGSTGELQLNYDSTDPSATLSTTAKGFVLYIFGPDPTNALNLLNPITTTISNDTIGSADMVTTATTVDNCTVKILTNGNQPFPNGYMLTLLDNGANGAPDLEMQNAVDLLNGTATLPYAWDLEGTVGHVADLSLQIGCYLQNGFNTLTIPLPIMPKNTTLTVVRPYKDNISPNSDIYLKLGDTLALGNGVTDYEGNPIASGYTIQYQLLSMANGGAANTFTSTTNNSTNILLPSAANEIGTYDLLISCLQLNMGEGDISIPLILDTPNGAQGYSAKIHCGFLPPTVAVIGETSNTISIVITDPNVPLGSFPASYNVQYSTNGTTWTTNNITASGAAQTGDTVISLTAATPYQIQVSADCTGFDQLDDQSVYSTPVTATTLAAPTP